MAEGFARAAGGGGWEVWSAGSRPSGKVNETAITLMQERGVDLSTHRSKTLAELPSIVWDYVVTMGCGDSCRSVPAKERLDWNIPDPKDLSLEQFREVRDGIERLVQRLMEADK